MPALVVILTAAESKLGRALRRDEVGEMTSKSAAIMTQRRVVIELERSRDYAEIDPELAWEQWEIVRAMRAML